MVLFGDIDTDKASHLTKFNSVLVWGFFRCGALWRRREQHPGVTLPTDLGPVKG